MSSIKTNENFNPAWIWACQTSLQGEWHFIQHKKQPNVCIKTSLKFNCPSYIFDIRMKKKLDLYYAMRPLKDIWKMKRKFRVDYSQVRVSMYSRVFWRHWYHLENENRIWLVLVYFKNKILPKVSLWVYAMWLSIQLLG